MRLRTQKIPFLVVTILVTISISVFAQTVSKPKALVLKEVKVKKANDIRCVYGLLDTGGKRPLMVFLDVLKNGEKAIATAELSKKGKGKKYSIVFSTKGYIGSTSCAVANGKPYVMYYYQTPGSSSPATQQPWDSHIRVQNISSNDTKVNIQFYDKKGKPNAHFHAEVSLGGCGNGIGAMATIYENVNQKDSVQAFGQLFDSSGNTVSDRIIIPVPTNYATDNPVSRLVPGSNGNGWYGSAIFYSGDDTIVSTLAVQNTGTSTSPVYTGFYNQIWKNTWPEYPRSEPFYCTCFSVQNSCNREVPIVPLLYSSARWPQDKTKVYQQINTVYRLQNIGGSGESAGKPKNLKGMKPGYIPDLSNYSYTYVNYNDRYSGAATINSDQPIVTVVNVLQQHHVRGNNAVHKGPHPGAGTDKYGQKFTVYEINTAKGKAKVKAQATRYIRFSSINPPVMEAIGKQYWIIVSGQNFNEDWSKVFLAIYK